MEPLELIFGPLGEFARYYRPIFPTSNGSVAELVILAGMCFVALLWFFNA
ncbi:MAG: hypothetical protein IT324_14855 [Anaerolineae bacterium]|nr:hypothetical protein [Anaerolineae bacterium]